MKKSFFNLMIACALGGPLFTSPVFSMQKSFEEETLSDKNVHTQHLTHETPGQEAESFPTVITQEISQYEDGMHETPGQEAESFPTVITQEISQYEDGMHETPGQEHWQNYPVVLGQESSPEETPDGFQQSYDNLMNQRPGHQDMIQEEKNKDEKREKVYKIMKGFNGHKKAKKKSYGKRVASLSDLYELFQMPSP